MGKAIEALVAEYNVRRGVPKERSAPQGRGWNLLFAKRAAPPHLFSGEARQVFEEIITGRPAARVIHKPHVVGEPVPENWLIYPEVKLGSYRVADPYTSNREGNLARHALTAVPAVREPGLREYMKDEVAAYGFFVIKASGSEYPHTNERAEFRNHLIIGQCLGMDVRGQSSDQARQFCAFAAEVTGLARVARA